MKTKIKTISPDQNIIEHESGLRTVFVESKSDTCEKCVYSKNTTIDCKLIPCSSMKRTCRRNDFRMGYFK